ncbi:hypothetical protein KBX06_17585 [Micromonospora sp. C31]|uniref:hypothetical protein n=1 Tax=Micromonospora sp. C31 TaxID=2824876 RepID=UPI001B3593D3|nr:hypothetical protein [Micromonospora sp. C31]MBQ1074963.1 hypothetical protein [Micromonospora sp. C31]
MSGPPGPPDWLAAVLAALTEGHEPATPPGWRRRVDVELDRLASRVPFRVVYDWHARVLASTPGGDAGRLVGELHRRALAGDRPGAHEWHAALRPALRELYRAAYPYAEARAVAYANADAYARANGYGPDEATGFAAHYADLSTGANAEAFADANAIANADALAPALARADGPAYAEAYPAALVRAYALAAANRAGTAGAARVLRAAYERLAEALAESLRDVSD